MGSLVWLGDTDPLRDGPQSFLKVQNEPAYIERFGPHRS